MRNVATIVLIIVIGAGGFFGGIQYQKSKSSQSGFQARGQFQQRSRQGFRPVNGEVISQDDKSITVKLQDGSSKIVLLSDSTAFSKSAEGSKTDLKTGDKVAVFGIENSDGSITAQSVQLNPVFRNAPQQK